jgi:hypothetical protein
MEQGALLSSIFYPPSSIFHPRASILYPQSLTSVPQKGRLITSKMYFITNLFSWTGRICILVSHTRYGGSI